MAEAKRFDPFKIDLNKQRVARGERAVPVRPETGFDKSAGEFIKDVMVPQTPLDVALMMIGGPGPKALKKGAVALGGALTGGQAEAGKLDLVNKLLRRDPAQVLGATRGSERASEAAAALPMDEAARHARAKELGFTVDAYKGAYPYDYNTVPVRNWKGEVIEGADRVPQPLTEFDARKSSVPGADYAGFFSNDPSVASRFATVMGEGAVYPVKLKFDNPKVIDANGAFAADFQFGPGAGRLKLEPDSPHDGVILRNTKDEGDVYIPRRSNQVRSRFATFNPDNKDSGNLLASLLGIAVPTAAASGPAPDFLNQLFLGTP